MLKKLGLLALSTIVLGSPLLGIASANTVDGYTSDSEICVYSFNDSDSPVVSPTHTCGWSDIDSDTCFYAYLDVDSVPTYVINGYSCNDNYDPVLVSSSPYSLGIQFRDDSLYFYSDASGETSSSNSGKIYISASPITYSPSAGGDSSDGSIGIPSGFTDSVNGLVSNFAGSIGNYAPTLIIVGLGVVLLFTFWGVIRSWAVRIFNRKGR